MLQSRPQQALSGKLHNGFPGLWHSRSQMLWSVLFCIIKGLRTKADSALSGIFLAKKERTDVLSLLPRARQVHGGARGAGGGGREGDRCSLLESDREDPRFDQEPARYHNRRPQTGRRAVAR